ncbi:DUF952 domain-containing protein [Pseudonocardia sp. MH-G8]|uniref:DUF952 domain-containing protein n=1 Tax=Pseudonocardia sp. MH-G8 TaxID=1854588 RepID=UPI002100E000|nr:DUF952 domain-containing protein [Pseudonocardia sp. MH-G8]
MDTTPLLHISNPTEWETMRAAGVIAPPSLDEVGFVHLSTPEQVALPANRIYGGRSDLLLLVLDPERIGVEVRFEPGVPTDPESMRFPHAYGPIPTSAVVDVRPYAPGPDGSFGAPDLSA